MPVINTTTAQTSNDDITQDQTAGDVDMALSMTDTYVSTGTQKLEMIMTTVLGPSSKQYGLTAKNLQRIMIFVGAYVSLSYVWKKAGDHKVKVFGSLIGIYIARRIMEQNSASSTQSSENNLL